MRKGFIFASILLAVIVIALMLVYYGSKGNETDFDNQLFIPQLLSDIDPDPNTAEFELKAQNGVSSMLDGHKTQTMGYNGNFLGPIIRVKNGEQVKVHISNELDESTSVHWHGLIVDGTQDGGPHQHIMPGESVDVTFEVDQPAATLWYHPHVIGTTATQVYYGLAGMIIVQDQISEALNLPDEYGVNDIPLIIQDRSFDANGNFDYNSNMMDGALGDRFMVNGNISPVLEVKRQKMRFRVLNGSNAMNYDLSFDRGLEFHQIASDGGLLQRPIKMERLFLSPAERGEIIVDFTRFKDGDVVTLRNGGIPIMNFNVSGMGQEMADMPDRLVEIEKIADTSMMPKKEIFLNGMGHMVSINGRKFDLERVDDQARVGVSELWEVTNIGSMMHSMGHPFHIHGVQFRIISRSSGPLEDNEQGFKDTVFIEPNETVKLVVTFKNKGLFMYHCHILEHEEAGMMGQIEVSE